MRELGHNDPDRARTQKQVALAESMSVKSYIDIDDVENIEVDGVDTKDYPDFVDAYFSYAEWKDGTPLTDSELEDLTETYPCVLNVMAFEHYL